MFVVGDLSESDTFYRGGLIVCLLLFLDPCVPAQFLSVYWSVVCLLAP